MKKILENFVKIKREFASTYSGSAHIQEIIPKTPSDDFSVNASHLQKLHEFAKKNPIYYNSYEENISETPCVVYEGDINDYWLNSIKHGSSCQPFYPTWMFSAYLMAVSAKELGYSELVDIGSGDGRIAFCGDVIGLKSHSIEIDDGLVELQKLISTKTNHDFHPICQDALDFDYARLNLKSPAFFIGGLAQMGGDMLATSIIEKISLIGNLRKSTAIVFAGTNSKRNLSNNQSEGGWSNLIQKYDLDVLLTLSLPTVWTFDQKIETPYIYTKFK